MNRIRLRNNKVRITILILSIILFCYIYIVILIKTSFKDLIIKESYSRYETNKYSNIVDKLLYNSLLKVVSKTDYEEINYVKTDMVNKEIDMSNEVNEIVNDPKVYIYNSHDTEKYYLPFVSDYSITPDVKLASYILKDYLNDNGIESTVESKSINDYLKKNNLDYKGCYEASRSYMLNEMKKHEYKILLDIHRDSVKRKYTLYEKDNVKYAKIMFVLTTKHKNYKRNEKFANYLNNYINKKYIGLSRGIMRRKDVIFNQDLSDNAILIELGGVDNTIEEINNTLKVLSEALISYIKEYNL